MSEHNALRAAASIPAGYASAQDFARAQAARGGNYSTQAASAEVLPAPTPTTDPRQSAPVSREFIRAEHEKRVIAETSSWFDHQIGNGRAVTGAHSDYEPGKYLRAHGYVAVNGAGEVIEPSPAQARGLVAELIKAMGRQGSRTSPTAVTTSISYRDQNRPPKDALVTLRKAF